MDVVQYSPFAVFQDEALAILNSSDHGMLAKTDITFSCSREIAESIASILNYYNSHGQSFYSPYKINCRHLRASGMGSFKWQGFRIPRAIVDHLITSDNASEKQIFGIYTSLEFSIHQERFSKDNNYSDLSEQQCFYQWTGHPVHPSELIFARFLNEKSIVARSMGCMQGFMIRDQDI